MTKYDFTTIPNRLDHNSVKWQEIKENPHKLPLWVADMDFLTLPEIKQSIHDYADYGVYGYAYVEEDLIKSIQNWEKNQHQYDFSKEALILVEGVVPGIGLAIQALTKENDAVLINTPVPPFARTVKLNNRKLIENKLMEKNGEFLIDFEVFEKEIVENSVKLYILCNPHNPGGRVWTKEELIKLGQICKKHNVIVVSDEIHQDLTLFGHQHQTFNTLSEDFKDFSVVLSSATKSFNIAGVKCAYAIIENQDLREKYLQRRLANNQQEISTLGMLATKVAYENGNEWLNELKNVLEKNITYIESELHQKTKIKVMKPQGTYLIWLDFSEYQLEDKVLDEKLAEEAGVILNKGISFGKAGQAHARLNAAAPFSLIEEASKRLVETFKI
ncbi:MalY/PatB family protein [Lactococcus lactis]|uniref:cysteine-S-conjugate beta-lyase n=1 Tax=Lactococcus lactis TaxID=1358 RepID=A0A552Z1K6_9LACT|nr:MalY/PatB family protein [Lactococcus lactis]MCT0078738.1 pyridoxal phosphate-dependent aminotransferase [Lactococcus lactis subsp. lactis]MCT0442162.1 pyridoxal phosphate-dependent aminotransferase [Lactococcus lactis subsp. lactis]TRW73405.1 pyridoxal phosphate-dependent aminotransferase [Lactococcus lactis]